MPSIRIPISLKKALRSELGGVTLQRDGAAGVLTQPPLDESDPRLQAFLRVNFDVFYDWNIQTGAVYFAEQLDELLGLPHGAFPRSLEGWLENVHPHDHDAVCADLWESVTSGRSFRGEYRLRRADDTYLTVSDQGVVLIDAEGRPTNMIGAMRDVTGDREAERARLEAEELRHVLFRIGKPAMQIDAAGHYVDATPAALEFFGRSAEDMLAGNVRDDFPPPVLELIGAGPLDESGAELEVDCVVGGEVKSLVLTVLPCHLGDGPGFFLLGTDISSTKELQRELARSERALRRQATITDERNAALRVLLEQREQDRAELEQRVVGNVEQLIEPTLDRLSRALRHRPERLELEALRTNLREIVGPFAQRLREAGGGVAPLTRRETEVANLVRLGKTSDEIAEALHISRSSVAFHRANVRRKLGIPKRGPHLATHLASMGEDRAL